MRFCNVSYNATLLNQSFPSFFSIHQSAFSISFPHFPCHAPPCLADNIIGPCAGCYPSLLWLYSRRSGGSAGGREAGREDV